MKENAKIILVSIITIIISITGSAVANTMLQANSISYKTSNGETVDVNSALDRLFDINTVNERLGNTDISSIGDGTVTGAISGLNSNLSNKLTYTEIVLSSGNTANLKITSNSQGRITVIGDSTRMKEILYRCISTGDIEYAYNYEAPNLNISVTKNKISIQNVAGGVTVVIYATVYRGGVPSV